MVKETLTAKVSPKTMGRLEDYAEREGISKSEGTDRLLKQGLDVEESDMRLVPVRSDGGTVIEDRLDEIETEIGQVNQSVEGSQSDLREILYLLSAVAVGVLGSVALFVFPQPWNIATAGLGTFVMVFSFVFLLARKIHA